MRTNMGTFGDSVQTYLRTSGYSQKELADELGLHPKVLSRKLNGSGNAQLTRLEVQRIIIPLARWRVIPSQEEALHLFELAEVEPPIFSDDEGRTPPLNTRAAKRAQPTPSSAPSFPPSPQKNNPPAPTTRLIGRE